MTFALSLRKAESSRAAETQRLAPNEGFIALDIALRTTYALPLPQVRAHNKSGRVRAWRAANVASAELV
jgi:hypothetical protein